MTTTKNYNLLTNHTVSTYSDVPRINFLKSEHSHQVMFDKPRFGIDNNDTELALTIYIEYMLYSKKELTETLVKELANELSAGRIYNSNNYMEYNVSRLEYSINLKDLKNGKVEIKKPFFKGEEITIELDLSKQEVKLTNDLGIRSKIAHIIKEQKIVKKQNELEQLMIGKWKSPLIKGELIKSNISVAFNENFDIVNKEINFRLNGKEVVFKFDTTYNEWVVIQSDNNTIKFKENLHNWIANNIAFIDYVFSKEPNNENMLIGLAKL